MGGDSTELLKMIRKLDANDPTENWIGPYAMIKTLGQGATGVVRYAKRRDARIVDEKPDDEVAIKIVDLVALKDLPDERRRVDREITILRLVDHPYLMKMHDLIQNKTHKYMILEYLPGGELYDLIMRNGGRLAPDDAFKYFFQLLVGVAYMHRRKLVHRDIKLENMIRDAKGDIKLADFGMSCEMPPGGKLKESVGSPHYACPEIVQGNAYDGYQADAWSTGVVLFVLLTGNLPFMAEDTNVLYEKISKGDYRMPSELPDPAQELIRGLINPSGSRRLDVDGIAKSKWFHSRLPRVTPAQRKIFEAEFPSDDDFAEHLHHKLLPPSGTMKL